MMDAFRVMAAVCLAGCLAGVSPADDRFERFGVIAGHAQNVGKWHNLEGTRGNRLSFHCEEAFSIHRMLPGQTCLAAGSPPPDRRIRPWPPDSPRFSHGDADISPETPVYKKRARLKKQFGL